MSAIIIFCLYLIFIYYIGFKGYQRIKTAEDLIVAGWSMPLYVVTGSLIAALLHVKMKKSVPAIFLGLIMATIIMLIISYGGLAAIINFFS